MKTDIDKLISLTYEIEGLLLLLRDRSHESVAPYISNLLSDKGRMLAKYLSCEEVNDIPEPKQEPENPTLPPVPPVHIEKQNIPAPPVATDESEKQPTSIENSTTFVEKTPTIEEITTPEPEIKADNTEVISTAEVPVNNEYVTTVPESGISNHETAQPEFNSNEEAGARMLKLLTLNDRFRFRRELFGGSDTVMKSILSVISTMPTLEDAKRYLTEAQGMDAENEEVIYFLEIIAPNYQ